MTRVHLGWWISGSALALVLVTAEPARGQEKAPPTPSATDSAESTDIVVSARKRAESITDVPTAVTAITAEGLAARGITDYNGLNQFVPGFHWNQTGSSNSARTFNTFVIRGTYSGSDHPDRQNVSLFMDGVPLGGAGSIPGLTDVRQVEVVKGPQSAYFGRSTFGGAVNFITRVPGDHFAASASVDVASYDNQEVNLSVEGPIVPDLLSVRLSGRVYHYGAQFDNYGFGGELGERRTDSIAGAFSLTPAANFKMRGYFTYWRDKDGPFASALLTKADYNCNGGAAAAGTLNYVCGEIGSTPLNRIAQNVNIDPVRLAQLVAGNRVEDADFITGPGFRRSAYFGSLAAEYTLPNDWTVAANGGVVRNRYAVIADNGNRYPANGVYSVTLTPWDIINQSAEFRLTTDTSKPLKVMVGSNYFRQVSYTGSNSIRNTSTALIPGLPYQRGSAKTFGVFGSIGYDITSALSVSAEGRYQWDQIRSTVLATGGINAQATTRSFTPRVIAQYKFMRDANMYVSYSEGTRPSQFNTNVFSLSAAARAELAAQADIPIAVPEERLRMGEFGFKGDFFDHRLHFLSAVYYGAWRDRQIQQTLQYHATPTTLTSLLVYLPNGKVNIYGIEAEGHYDATHTLTFDATYDYAETDIRNTYCTDCRAITGNPTPVGTRIPRYPAVTGTGSIDYHPPLSELWTGIARFDWIHTGKQYDTEANVAWVAASDVFNLRVGARTDKLSIELYVKNLLDDDTPLNIGRAGDTYDSSNTVLLAPAQRRIVGVRAASSF